MNKKNISAKINMLNFNVKFVAINKIVTFVTNFTNKQKSIIMSFNKKEVGELIKTERINTVPLREGDKVFTQGDYAIKLEREFRAIGINIKLDGTRLSRIENGLEPKEEFYIEICNILDIDIPWKKEKLKVAFSQGYWAAPLIWINERASKYTFMNEVEIAAYSDKNTANEPIWNDGEKLKGFDKEKNIYFYSGQILSLLKANKIDIGFLGNAVVGENKELIRIARVVDGSLLRHAMIFVAPKNRFKNQKEVIEFLLTKPKKGKECTIFYPSNSTAEKEYIKILQSVGHERKILEVFDLSIFEKEFKEKINLEDAKPIAHVGLMASIEIAEKIVKNVGNDKIDVFSFRTIEIINMMQEMGIDKKIDNMYYEMVTQNDADSIKKIAQSNGFKLLLAELNNTIEELNKVDSKDGIPYLHEVVATFFGHDRERTSELLFKAKFELMFYPEWLNIILDIGRQEK
jgi:hypothetical protein